MAPPGNPPFRRRLAAVGMLVLAAAAAPASRGAGVTIVTHGFNADVDAWVIPMLEAIPRRFHRLGATNAACLQVTMVNTGGGNHAFSVVNLNGVSPAAPDTGEILIKFDWSDYAGSLFSVNFSTTYVAERLVPALLDPQLIPGLGRPLAELPLHLAGHSRGASLVCEVTRLLGAQGVWVDHLTLMDPYPLNNDGNSDPYSVVDGSCQVYANVLFADNYWQNIGGFLVPTGQPRPGAYNRRLTNLSGGYSSAHSDVHLWYHGTMDLRTPITVDGATIGAAERTNWWTSFEARGTNAGFHYSLIAGGNRLSDAEPAGPGLGRIRDGFNQRWDLGGGVSSNRTALPFNAGAWPNPVRFDVTGTNAFAAGASTALRLYHQSAADTNATITFQVLLDPDLNPFNGNELPAQPVTAPGTGTNAVQRLDFDLVTDAMLVPPGNYAVGVVASEGPRRRHLYAPQLLAIGPSLLPPVIAQVARSGNSFELTVQGTVGQRLVVERTADLTDWLPVATNVVGAAPWVYLDSQALEQERRFYRAVLAP
jgi:hypothetical protein